MRDKSGRRVPGHPSHRRRRRGVCPPSGGIRSLRAFLPPGAWGGVLQPPPRVPSAPPAAREGGASSRAPGPRWDGDPPDSRAAGGDPVERGAPSPASSALALTPSAACLLPPGPAGPASQARPEASSEGQRRRLPHPQKERGAGAGGSVPAAGSRARARRGGRPASQRVPPGPGRWAPGQVWAPPPAPRRPRDHDAPSVAGGRRGSQATAPPPRSRSPGSPGGQGGRARVPVCGWVWAPRLPRRFLRRSRWCLRWEKRPGFGAVAAARQVASRPQPHLAKRGLGAPGAAAWKRARRRLRPRGCGGGDVRVEKTAGTSRPRRTRAHRRVQGARGTGSWEPGGPGSRPRGRAPETTGPRDGGSPCPPPHCEPLRAPRALPLGSLSFLRVLPRVLV